MRKSSDCEHQFEHVPDCAPAYENKYECECGMTWSSEWSCMCDDRCPKCGTSVTPHDSVVVATCACRHLS